MWGQCLQICFDVVLLLILLFLQLMFRIISYSSKEEMHGCVKVNRQLYFFMWYFILEFNLERKRKAILSLIYNVLCKAFLFIKSLVISTDSHRAIWGSNFSEQKYDWRREKLTEFFAVGSYEFVVRGVKLIEMYCNLQYC